MTVDLKRIKHNEAARKYVKQNPEKRKRSVRKYKISSKGKLHNVLHGAKTRARKAGVEFNLKYEEIVLPSFCPVLGIPLDQHGPRDNKPSLDRLDNSKGYTKDNVRIISMRANRIKSDATLAELKAIVAYIEHDK